MSKFALAVVFLAACGGPDEPIEPPVTSIAVSLDDDWFDPDADVWNARLTVENADSFAVFVQPVEAGAEPVQADVDACDQGVDVMFCRISVPFLASDAGSDLYVYASNDVEDAYVHAAWLPMVPR